MERPVFHHFSVLTALAFWLTAFLPAFPQLTPSVKKDAERVLLALDRIEAESGTKKGKALSRTEFSESELNAYIAYRIAAEPDGVLRLLVLKLLDGNKVEGRAFLDLSGARLPFGLKPRMNLFFGGRVSTKAGAVRLEFDELFLEDRSVPLMFLDMIILAAAALGKSDAGSINDWYELPYGIQEIKTSARKLALFHPP
ncbi:MAG: hypothetical protein FJY80_02180 [Candidatus Aminicenantes bacterium]|nr:hypothetical protein [Candidatus Aminicenantes bacterium]MBM3310294.1 hypothetical protein [Candidatus Aminicenantes bacterium]